MKTIRFPIAYSTGKKIAYPDNISKFSDTVIQDGYVYGYYSGDLELEEAEYPAPEVLGPAQLSPYAFMNLLGDQNMVAIMTMAKTDPIVELLIEKLRRAELVDFDDTRGGPQAGLAYLLSVDLLTQNEYDRVMRREFLS